MTFSSPSTNATPPPNNQRKNEHGKYCTSGARCETLAGRRSTTRAMCNWRRVFAHWPREPPDGCDGCCVDALPAPRHRCRALQSDPLAFVLCALYVYIYAYHSCFSMWLWGVAYKQSIMLACTSYPNFTIVCVSVFVCGCDERSERDRGMLSCFYILWKTLRRSLPLHQTNAGTYVHHENTNHVESQACCNRNRADTMAQECI